MATVNSTKAYVSKYPDLKFKKLGKTDLTTSICGFGCYRVDDAILEHHKALEFALDNGINLIDTSSNYASGGSEKLVGNVLRKLTTRNRNILDEIIIVTKGGYLQVDNLKYASEREEAGNPFPEVVKCSPDLWHCIHPEFLKVQIDNSLERLQLNKIDVYLLHNPEYFLTYSNLASLEEKRDEYYKRIKEAFLHLETEVKNGRISYYGISSNTFVETPEKNNFNSLEKVYEIASGISDDNHFAVIQFPLNLIEKGAVTNKNQQQGKKTLLDFTSEKNLATIVNRPLNAISNNRIVRLADFSLSEDRNRDEISDLISDLIKTEDELVEEFVNKIEIESVDKNNLIQCLSTGMILESNYDRFESPNQFKDMKGMYLIPRANFAINEIGKYFGQGKHIVNRLNNYALTVNIALDSVESDLARHWNEKNKILHNELDEYLDETERNLNLSQKSLMFINSLSEISSTLVGMRSLNYVKDVVDYIKVQSDRSLENYWGNK
ncbi:MAG: aldo/keto reductase [Ignavibacterium sp.]|nr:MAG: aldo/keto reductase [Ignavibacterium sp.]